MLILHYNFIYFVIIIIHGYNYNISIFMKFNFNTRGGMYVIEVTINYIVYSGLLNNSNTVTYYFN